MAICESAVESMALSLFGGTCAGCRMLVTGTQPSHWTSIDYFVMDDLGELALAISYFAPAINAASPLDPFPLQLASELRANGCPDLTAQMEQLAQTRLDAAGRC